VLDAIAPPSWRAPTQSTAASSAPQLAAQPARQHALVLGDVVGGFADELRAAEFRPWRRKWRRARRLPIPREPPSRSDQREPAGFFDPFAAFFLTGFFPLGGSRGSAGSSASRAPTARVEFFMTRDFRTSPAAAATASVFRGDLRTWRVCARINR
jgi:hypothetical protein